MILNLTRVVGAFRQLGFPQEFRIEETAGWRIDANDLRTLATLIGKGGGNSGTETLEPGAVRGLGNVTWNLISQVKQLGDTTFDRALKERVELLTERLQEAGIELVDFTGQDVDDDEIWDNVVGSEGRKLDPVIIGMARPRIKYRSVVVQRGIPIVEDRSATKQGGLTK